MHPGVVSLTVGGQRLSDEAGKPRPPRAFERGRHSCVDIDRCWNDGVVESELDVDARAAATAATTAATVPAGSVRPDSAQRATRSATTGSGVGRIPLGQIGQAGIVGEHLDDRHHTIDALLEPLDLQLLVPQRQGHNQAGLTAQPCDPLDAGRSYDRWAGRTGSPRRHRRRGCASSDVGGHERVELAVTEVLQ